MATDLIATPVNTRPTLRINGEAHAVVDELLQSLVLKEATGGLSALEVTLIDWTPRGTEGAGFAFDDSAILKLGSEIKAYAGSIAAPQEIFRGRISALEFQTPQDGPPLITVLAEDPLQGARKTRRSRLFEAASPADVVRAVATEHGLRPVIRAGLNEPVMDWMQMNQSDLAFLRAILERVDGDVQVVGEELQAGPRSGPARNQVELRLHDNLLSVSIAADLAEQVIEQRVTGFNPATGEEVKAVVTSGQLGPGEGITGAAIVARALGINRAETHGYSEALSQSEADVMAKACFQQRARRFVRATGRAAGNPALRVGTFVTLQRVSPLVAGTYIVTQATHRFDQRTGYVTHFCAESAYFGGRA
jgi:uncharacterized protein